MAPKEWVRLRPYLADTPITGQDLENFITVSSVLPSLKGPDEYLRRIYGRMRGQRPNNVCVRVRRQQNSFNPNYLIETWTGNDRSRAMWAVGEYSGRTHKPLVPAARGNYYWSDFEMEFVEIEALFARIRGAPYPPR